MELSGFILEQLVNGLTLGSLYALVAIGLALVVGVLSPAFVGLILGTPAAFIAALGGLAMLAPLQSAFVTAFRTDRALGPLVCLLVTVAEMALAGNMGAEIALPEGVSPTGWLFGEDQGRYVVTTSDAPALCAAANALGIPALPIGETGGQAVSILNGDEVSLDALRKAHESFFPELMGADAALA